MALVRKTFLFLEFNPEPSFVFNFKIGVIHNDGDMIIEFNYFL